MGASGDNGVDKDAFSVVLREIAEHEYPGITLVGPPGTGKCHGKNTPIMMFDGSTKMVQNVEPGELLMGPDSKPRKVLSTARGYGNLYRVFPTKGMSYVVNEDHILSLKMNVACSGKRKGEIVNIGVLDYLKSSQTFRDHAKGYRVGVDFAEKSVEIDPYILGVWIGDGQNHHPMVTTPDVEVFNALASYAFANELELKAINHQNSGLATTYSITSGFTGTECHGKNKFLLGLNSYRLIANKHLPSDYLINSRKVRLELFRNHRHGRLP